LPGGTGTPPQDRGRERERRPGVGADDARRPAVSIGLVAVRVGVQAGLRVDAAGRRV
jgi:hypothetical protein